MEFVLLPIVLVAVIVVVATVQLKRLQDGETTIMRRRRLLKNFWP
jgi:hypothetical protein